MTRQRVALYVLLAVVAVAAAVLSFNALRDLALVCGFDAWLAPLLPVTIDAGAAAGSIVWLGSGIPAGARRYGRALAVLLLGSSVGGNALGHGLAAFEARPDWLVVVGVSAIAPAVLGALVHLVVLVVRPEAPTQVADGGEVAEPQVVLAAAETPARVVERPALRIAPAKVAAATVQATVDEDTVAKAQELLAAGAGRPRLARELGLKPHQARALRDADPAEVPTVLARYRARA